MNKRKFLRTDEVRDIYGMRGSAFRKMCLTGKVTGAVKIGKCWYAPVETLKRMFQEEKEIGCSRSKKPSLK